jgi:hypothetical protein
MTDLEVKEAMYLLGVLWNNYKPPQTQEAVAVAVNVWMQFFSAVPADEVTAAIMEFAASGGSFAPQVGQIYDAVKQAREERAWFESSQRWVRRELSGRGIGQLESGG